MYLFILIFKLQQRELKSWHRSSYLQREQAGSPRWDLHLSLQLNFCTQTCKVAAPHNYPWQIHALIVLSYPYTHHTTHLKQVWTLLWETLMDLV